MKVLLYGIGIRYEVYFCSTRFWWNYLEQRDTEVVAALDKKIKKPEGELLKEGIRVYHPSNLPAWLDYENILVLSKKYYLEIKKELISQGLGPDSILLWDDFAADGIAKVLHQEMFFGKAGLEIGGPSDIFSEIYNVCQSCDGANFATHTVWNDNSMPDYMFAGKRLGNMIIADATDLHTIADKSYDFLLSSNNLEHIANPLKALREFRRVIKSSGIICVLVPQKEFSFDHNRKFTSFAHILEDDRAGMEETDLTHLTEITQKHDYAMDVQCGGKEQFLLRAKKNYENRCLHHHVFCPEVLRQMFEYLDIEVFDQFELNGNYGILGSVAEVAIDRA